MYNCICAGNCCCISMGIGCLPKRKIGNQKSRICNWRLIFFDIFIWSRKAI